MTNDPFNPPLREGESIGALLSAERHRAKNTLQVVASLLSLQAREVADAGTRNLFVAAQDRVRLIAIVYDRLSRSGTSGRLDFADALKEIVATTIRSQPAPAVAAQVIVEALQVDLDTAIPLALIAYELLSDSLAHAFTGRAAGRIEVTLRVPVTLGECVLTIGDDGIQRTPMGTGDTLRGKIVDVLIRQLKARLTLESVSGTKLAVRFPLPV
jgi:two-component sensor histidine kinase